MRRLRDCSASSEAPTSCINAALPSAIRRSLLNARDTAPGDRLKVRHVDRRDAARRGAINDGACQRMLAGFLESRRDARALRLRFHDAMVSTSMQAWACQPSMCRSCRAPAYRSRAGARWPGHPGTSTPSCAPRPLATMMEMGVASPSAHGQAMMSTATALTIAYARRGSGPTNHQVANVINAMHDDRGNEPRGNVIGQALQRRAAALRLRDQRDDLRRAGCRRPHALRSTTTAPVWLSVAPTTRSPGPLSTGRGSPVSMDSSKVERPSSIRPSTGTFSPGRTRTRSPITS